MNGKNRMWILAAGILLLRDGLCAEANWQGLLASARAVARTNSAAALTICDKAVAVAGSNAAPWVLRAAIHDSRRELKEALSDLSKAVELQPESAEAWQLRGAVDFKLSRFRESVSDFDRYLALKPEQRPYHWQRGISLYYAGDYEEGRKQFELHETVNPNDVENAVWHFLCTARSKGVERARKTLLKPGPDARVPMAQILELFGGRGSADAVLEAARSRGNDTEAMFYAYLYLGLYFDAVKDDRQAREYINKAAAMAPNHYMGDVARVHAGVLRQR